MKQTMQTRATPSTIWAAWEKAHASHGSLEAGTKAARGNFQYEIVHVERGKSFSILWKTFFVRLIFTHEVVPIPRGAEISYSFHIKGPFAWPVRWLLGKKIAANLALVLKAVVKQIEEQHT